MSFILQIGIHTLYLYVSSGIDGLVESPHIVIY